MKHVLDIQNLSIGFRNRDLVKDVYFSVSGGQMIALKGRNGTGKTTLLRAIAGLHRPLNGQVLVDGINLTSLSSLEKAKKIAMVLTQKQNPAGIDVLTLVSMGRFPHASSFGWVSKGEKEIAISCLEKLQISHLATSSLATLSDGELQKVMIARALAQQSAFILMDEPTAFLDYIAKDEIFELMSGIAKSENVGILFTSHDISLINTFADLVLLIEDTTLSIENR